VFLTSVSVELIKKEGSRGGFERRVREEGLRGGFKRRF